MKAHKKLCSNCDGYVHIYEMQCPYCGVDLSADEDSDVSLEDQEAYIEEERELIAAMPDAQEEEEAEWEEAPVSLEKSEKPEELDNPFAALVLLLPGSIFLFFGISLFLFSDNGFLTFRFNAKYWFLYLFGS